MTICNGKKKGEENKFCVLNSQTDTFTTGQTDATKIQKTVVVTARLFTTYLPAPLFSLPPTPFDLVISLEAQQFAG